MSRFRWFLAGALSLLVLQAVAATVVLSSARGLSAREQPTGIEGWIARRAREIALPAEAKTCTSPVTKTREALDEARAPDMTLEERKQMEKLNPKGPRG